MLSLRRFGNTQYDSLSANLYYYSYTSFEMSPLSKISNDKPPMTNHIQAAHVIVGKTTRINEMSVDIKIGLKLETGLKQLEALDADPV